MKNILKISMVLLIFIFVSCHEDKSIVSDLLDNVGENTAILRSVETLTNPDEITDCNLPANQCVLTPTELIAILPEGSEINPINSLLNFKFEVQDDQNGGLLHEVRMYGQLYQEQEITNSITDKYLIATRTVDQFTINDETNLPRTAIRITAPELYDVLEAPDVPAVNPNRTAFLLVTFELELTDGRIINENDTSAPVEVESFFNSPFRYRIVYLDFRTP